MPVLSGFLPIPLAMMIPFMGAQSLVLGKSFGEGFQYGKRRISAMTNEQFNALSPALLAQNTRSELSQMIPSLQGAIQDMRSFQTFIVHELIAAVQQLPQDIFGSPAASEFITNLTGQRINPSGNTDLQNLIKSLANFSVIPQAFADPARPTKPVITSGPIGPQQPTLDRLYSTLTVNQLRKLRNSGQTWYRVPKTQRTLIQKILDDNPVQTFEDAQKNIDARAPSVQQKIASLFNQIVGILKQSSARDAKKLFAMKRYNQYVQANRFRNLTLDTGKSIRARKPVPRYT